MLYKEKGRVKRQFVHKLIFTCTQYKETVTVHATEMSHLLEFSYTISFSKAGLELPQFISLS